jgi:hypothetical protein
MKIPFFKVFALAAMLAAGGSIVPVGAVFVRTPPPRPLVVGPVGRRPGPGFVWTGGYYRWGGTRGYVWVPGRWRRPPRARAVWVPPRWRRSRGGYTFVAGGWR